MSFLLAWGVTKFKGGVPLSTFYVMLTLMSSLYRQYTAQDTRQKKLTALFPQLRAAAAGRLWHSSPAPDAPKLKLDAHQVPDKVS